MGAILTGIERDNADYRLELAGRLLADVDWRAYTQTLSRELASDTNAAALSRPFDALRQRRVAAAGARAIVGSMERALRAEQIAQVPPVVVGPLCQPRAIWPSAGVSRAEAQADADIRVARIAAT